MRAATPVRLLLALLATAASFVSASDEGLKRLPIKPFRPIGACFRLQRKEVQIARSEELVCVHANANVRTKHSKHYVCMLRCLYSIDGHSPPPTPPTLID